MTTRIRRWIETDTGHRVPNHKSKCCHLHGHQSQWIPICSMDMRLNLFKGPLGAVLSGRDEINHYSSMLWPHHRQCSARIIIT